MVVKIRLARFGRSHQPVYNIVVAQARTAPQSRPLEVLGTYDPIPKKDIYSSAETDKMHKDIKLDITRAKYWIGVGAQPSDTVHRLLSMIGLIPPKPRPGQPLVDALKELRQREAREKEAWATQLREQETQRRTESQRRQREKAQRQEDGMQRTEMRETLAPDEGMRI